MKTRHGDYEICLDEVEGLGSFLEVERLGAEEDILRIQGEMKSFLASLGIAPEDMSVQRYDIMLLERGQGVYS